MGYLNKKTILKTAELPIPSISEREVLVKITAVSLEFHDLLVVENRIPFGIQLPHIPVSEGVGVIEDVGQEVTRWKKGDRVLIPFISRWEAGKNSPFHDQLRTGFTTPGLLAEFSVQPESTLVKIPSNLTDDEAATLPVGALTVWTILVEQANIRAGQTILTQGSGGVSLFAIQIAKMFGLNIISTTGNKEKEHKLKALGANDVINYKAYPQWSKEVRRLNGNSGVDVTLGVGGTDTIGESILSVKQHGFVGLIGLLTGTQLTIDLIPLLISNVRLQAYSVGNAESLAALARAMEVNKIRPVIDSVFSFDNVQHAFHRFKSGDAFGKVIIKM